MIALSRSFSARWMLALAISMENSAARCRLLDSALRTSGLGGVEFGLGDVLGLEELASAAELLLHVFVGRLGAVEAGLLAVELGPGGIEVGDQVTIVEADDGVAGFDLISFVEGEGGDAGRDLGADEHLVLGLGEPGRGDGADEVALDGLVEADGGRLKVRTELFLQLLELTGAVEPV
jgi:hypothetical protein